MAALFLREQGQVDLLHSTGASLVVLGRLDLVAKRRVMPLEHQLQKPGVKNRLQGDNLVPVLAPDDWLQPAICCTPECRLVEPSDKTSMGYDPSFCELAVEARRMRVRMIVASLTRHSGRIRCSLRRAALL